VNAHAGNVHSHYFIWVQVSSGAWDGVGSAEAEIVALSGPTFAQRIEAERNVNYWCEGQFWGKGPAFRVRCAHCPAARN